MIKLQLVLIVLSIQNEGTNDGRSRLAVNAFAIFKDVESTTVNSLILDSRAKEVQDIMLYLGLKNNEHARDMGTNRKVEKQPVHSVMHERYQETLAPIFTQSQSVKQFVKKDDIINITLDPAIKSKNVVYIDDDVETTTLDPRDDDNKESSKKKVISVELNPGFQNITIGANNTSVVSEIETIHKAPQTDKKLSAESFSFPRNMQVEETVFPMATTNTHRFSEEKQFKDQYVQVKAEANHENNPDTNGQIPKYKNKYILSKPDGSFAVQDYSEVYIVTTSASNNQQSHDNGKEYFPLSNMKKSKIPLREESKAKISHDMERRIKNILGLQRNNYDDITQLISKPEKSKINQRIVPMKNFKPKNMMYRLTAKPIDESDLIIEGSLRRGVPVNSNEHFEMPKDQSEESNTNESSEEAQYDDDVKFKKIWNTLGNNPNSLLNEFSNLILNYINKRTPNVAPAPVTTPEDDIDEIYVIQDQEKISDPIKIGRSRMKETTVSPTKVALHNILIEMRQMVETGDSSLTNYNWLSSAINIQVGVKKILKLCTSDDVSEQDWYLLLFTERLFEVARSRVPKKIRTNQLDQSCKFFAEILKQLRPLHRAMDKISAQKSVNRKQMFEGLRKDYLLIPTKERLLIVLLHSAVNRILEQIDLKLGEARESDTLSLLLAGKPRHRDKIKITSLKHGASKKKKNKSIREKINIAEVCADLIHDIVFVYRVLYELLR